MHVFREDLFKKLLTRERRRSDRSNQPFVVVVIAAGGIRGAGAPDPLDAVVGALAMVKRQTDIAGWLEEGGLIGVILCGFRTADLASACTAVEGRYRQEIARLTDPETVERLSMELHVYPEPRCAGADGRWPVDRLLYPELGGHRERRGIYETMKRGFDIAISLSVLVGLSPLLALIAALVKLGSPGAVIFKQVRIGQMTRPFEMWKFRTMYTGVDDTVHQVYVTSLIKAEGKTEALKRDGIFKLTDDPRVTWVGRWLRKTSLDELPQLWNVVRGDMSLVGPRPPVPYELEQYDAWHRRRVLEARPGVTGLWQVEGRSRTTFEEMVRLDLRYARQRSLWTDLKILLATPAAVVSGKGAC